jgi:hypothetical protein
MIPIDRDLDEEITTVELRIHQRTVRAIATGRRVGTVLQRSLTSPAVLLFAAGIGFTIGRMTEGNGAPGRSRLARALFSISQGVRAALAVVRAPTFVWLARVLGAERSEQSRKVTTVQTGATPSSTASFSPTPHA